MSHDLIASLQKLSADLLALRPPESEASVPLMVAVSGIDGSGKGFVSDLLVHMLRDAGASVALIGIDGWLNLPSKRFGDDDPATHFYEYAFRFDEMFSQLIAPLRETGEIDLVAQHADPTNAEQYHPHHYQIADVDFVVVEGIFLFQERFDFDYRVWIDCSFETALQRALKRNQEGLSSAEIIRDYDRIYFAAQRIHFQRDQPRERADRVISNDDQLP